MARWERDLRLRRRLGWLLVSAEVPAVTLNFALLFAAYAYRLNLRLGAGPEHPLIASRTVFFGLVAGASLACLAAAVVVAMLYLRGRTWARRALMAGNIVLVVLGVALFVGNRFLGGAIEPFVAKVGLGLPLVTVFPLLWPLLTFRPAPPPAPPA